MQRRIARAAVLMFAAAVSMLPLAAHAAYPDHPVKLVVGYAPGGPLDIVARLLGDKLSQIWGQPVVVENISGAAGNIAAERVVKAAPDGYTLMLGSNVLLAANPRLYKHIPFDPEKDFVLITELVYSPNVLVVGNDVPAKSVQDLVAYARANPGKLTFASAGVGTTQHLAGELFKSVARIDIQHVPYRGAAPAITDLLGGRVTMFFGPVAPLVAQIKAGKLRALAVTSAARFPAMPNLPTMIEAGYPGFVSILSLGFIAPAGTPNDIVGKVHRDSVKALTSADVRDRLQKIGTEPIGNSPAEFAAYIKHEMPQWAEVIKAAGLTGSE